MPQVNIIVIGAPPSAEQKAALFESITDLMVDILGWSRKSVVVSVTSAAPFDWSVAGDVQDGSVHIDHHVDGLQDEMRPALTLAARLFRLFSHSRSRRARIPRLETLHLSDHDLADLNLPPCYRVRLGNDRPFLMPDRPR
jgi:4-oxalocrotonate tautomerase family enzyme